MVANVSANQLMNQMQSMISRAESRPNLDNLAQTNGSTGLGNAFEKVLDNVNTQQVQANELKQAFAMGDPSVSLAQVMVASQKAKLGFEATVYVRKQMVQAYKDIMQMPV